MTDSVTTEPLKETAPGTIGPYESSVRAGLFSPALSAIGTASDALVVIAIAADLVITFVNTVERYLFGDSLVWGQDASTIALSLVTFLGGAAFYRKREGMAFTYVLDRARPSYRGALRSVGHWLVLLLAGCLLYAYPAFLSDAFQRTLPVLRANEAWVAIWMGIGYVLIALYAIEKLLAEDLRHAAIGSGGAAALALLVLGWQFQSGDLLADTDPLILMAVVMAVGFVTGVTIPFVLALGGLSFILVTGAMPLLAMPAAFEAGIASFVLLAVPFFLMAGVLMEYTGMASRLVDLLDAWVGHWPGGLLVTEILAMYVVSGMSGSKTADIATVGSVMRKPLRERGYNPGEFVAILSAGAAMGETVPPSLAMLILGSITTISVGALFLAGLAPAALLALAMIAGVFVRGRGGRFPRGRPFDVRRGLHTVPGAVPALLVPVIVIGGIVGGVATPTEASSFAVVYGLLAALFIYRSVSAATVWTLLREASLIGGIVLLILSAANLLTQAIVMDRLPQHLSALLTTAVGKGAFLFIVGAGLIVLGIVLEGLPALIIFGPLLLPIAENLGIHPLHFGIVIIMAMGIGVFAPPLGIGFYQACIVGGARTEEAFKPSLFYTAMLIVGLAFVIAFPEVTLMVPRLFGFLH